MTKMSMSSLLPSDSETKWVPATSRQLPVYTRPMVGSELWMHTDCMAWHGAGELCMGLEFTSSLGIEELRDRTREALNKFRFLCPIVACAIRDDICPRWVYTPSADREAWLNLAFVVEQRGSSLNISEFVKEVNLRRLPYTGTDGTSTLFRLYLLVKSNGGDNGRNEYGLFLHGPHSMMDGGSMLHALNLMCEWISGNGMDVTIVPSEEWKNLPVDVITATGGLSKEWETSGAELLQDLAGHVTRMLTPGHRLLSPSRPLNMSEAPLRCNITLSESETKAIAAYAKKLGFSVTALFKAANGLAQYQMNPLPPGAAVDFPATTVSPERYLKPPVNPKTYFISSLSVMPLCISMGQPLLQGNERRALIMAAKQIQEQYDKYLAHPCLPSLLAVFTNLPPPGGHPGFNTTLVPPWHFGFQNLGAVESRVAIRHDEICVDNLRFGSRLGTLMMVQMWTMHKRLHFQVEGAAAWGEERLKTVLEETVRIGSLIIEASAML